MKTAAKVTFSVLSGMAIFMTFCYAVYLEKKLEDLDDAVFQYMKEEHNEMIRRKHAGNEDEDLCDN